MPDRPGISPGKRKAIIAALILFVGLGAAIYAGIMYMLFSRVGEMSRETRAQMEAEAGSNDSYREGVDLYDEGDYEDALAQFEKAIELKHDHTSAREHKTNTLIMLGRYGEAVDSAAGSLDTDPGERRLREKLGLALLTRNAEGDAERGRDMLEGLIAEYDHDTSALYAYALLGRTEEMTWLYGELYSEPCRRFDLDRDPEFSGYRNDPALRSYGAQ